LIIAVAGKGGTGKTTLSALIIRDLRARGEGPILAVDADANANLAESLGLEVRETVGHMLSRFIGNKAEIPPGLTKEAYLEYQLHGLLVESPGLDLLVMGRGEGPGCYCYPNLILRKFVDELAPNYAHLVIDNEAGMEHLSRRTTDRVDALLLVSDYSLKGIRTARRLAQLVGELELEVGRMWLVLNRVPPQPDPRVEEELDRDGLKLLSRIPRDEAVLRFDLEERPLLELTDDLPVVRAVGELVDRLHKEA